MEHGCRCRGQLSISVRNKAAARLWRSHRRLNMPMSWGWPLLWCYLRNSSFKKDGIDYHAAADLTKGRPTISGSPSRLISREAEAAVQQWRFKAIGFGKTDGRMYTELVSDHPIDLCRYRVANGYMGRVGLINSGGESHGTSDLHDAVVTAVVNKRTGGIGTYLWEKSLPEDDERRGLASEHHSGCLSWVLR